MLKYRRSIGYIFAVVCLCILGTLPAHAQKVTVQLDPAQTEIHWTLTDTLHTVHGTFRLKSAAITFDAKTGAADGLLVVDPNSGESGDATRDGKMKKNILETEKYPQATFRPTQVTGQLKPWSSQMITVDGIFNIHGVDHPLKLEVKAALDGNKVAATTAFQLPYVAWGMKNPSIPFIKVGKEVSMEIVGRGTVEGVQ